MAVIAFIGLGQMGSPMASNLLKQGHQLSVFDVNPDAVQRLVDKGAQPASSPAQATIGAEFVITMLPNGDLVRSVLFGEQGVCETLSREALVIDMSTIHPLQTDNLIADMQSKAGRPDIRQRDYRHIVAAGRRYGGASRACYPCSDGDG